MSRILKDYHKERREGPEKSGVRAVVLLLFFVLAAGVVVWKLVLLMVFEHNFYLSLATDQQEIYRKLFPERGDIAVYDHETGTLFSVATNRTLNLVFADPRKIKDPVDTALRLYPLLNLDLLPDTPEDSEEQQKLLEERQTLLNKLAKNNDPYEVVQHGVSDELATKIRALNLPGIYFQDERFRYYPEPKFGGHLTGFLGYDASGNKVGRYGIEGFFERELMGKSGFLQSAQGAGGGWITLRDRTVEPAEDGATVVLTIDRAIQYFACDKLKKAVETHGALSGSIVILDAKTGAVLAMCSVPDFDPNDYRNVETGSVYNNQSIFGAYEPGSVMKAFTLAAAIDTGVVTPSSTYEDKGKVELGDFTIKNSDGGIPHGIQTMTQVLEKSLNTGAIYAEEKIPGDSFRQYLHDFGFGAPTGIELDTEVKGTLASLDKPGRIYKATASYGQGIMTTPIQIAAAFLALANDGKLMRPYIVDEVRYASGRVVKTQPVSVRQVVSARTASLVAAMLVSVVEKGHGKQAGVPGYWVAGKTGTAQVAKKDGSGYEPEETIGSFAGFAPVEDPKFVMVTRIDRPKDTVFAEITAAPLFGEIAKFLLQYLEVPSSR
ncbi:MAG: penicillin-binding protein 2 [bacterium]